MGSSYDRATTQVLVALKFEEDDYSLEGLMRHLNLNGLGIAFSLASTCSYSVLNFRDQFAYYYLCLFTRPWNIALISIVRSLR